MTPELDPIDGIIDSAARRPPKSPQQLRDDIGFDLTEDGIAQAFTARHKDNLRYCHHAQHWFVWRATHWCREESKLAFAWSREICRDLGSEAEQRDKSKLAKAAFASAVERFAQSDRAFAVTAETWDANRWLLGTSGGTVDLRTGALREAARGDYITKLTLVPPAAPGAPHPTWTKFLDEATGGDKELQAFLQRLAGYFLTGEVTEDILAFLYGEGGTGKGTFLGIIVSILHDYHPAVDDRWLRDLAKSWPW